MQTENSYGFGGAAAARMDIVRVGFIQRVYSLLTTSLFVSAFGAYLGSSLSPALVGPLSLLELVLLLVTFFTRNIPGLNVGMLFGFTFVTGLAMGPVLSAITALGHGGAILKALLMTGFTFGALTAYVFWSKTDFGFLGGFLFAALVGLCLASLAFMFTGAGQTTWIVYSYIGLMVFVGWILFDTSNILYRYPPNEFVAATIDLYLDILNIFWMLLRIYLSRDD